MHKFFEPDSVVIIGAPRNTGPGTYNGVELMRRYGYRGRIYPVNPQADAICGIKSYQTIAAVPEPADLALISIGRDLVPNALQECIASGIRRVIIISQGFSDADRHGSELQQEIASLARQSGTRVLGPNTMGVLNNFQNFLTGFIDIKPPRAFPPASLIAQTGLIQVASGNFAYQGWGKAIDIGNGCDVDFLDALDYFGRDPQTRIIALHMEGILRGREFFEKACSIACYKPIIALKTGRSRAGARAALSHTGSIVGEDAVVEAAFARAGIIRVYSNIEMSVAIRALLRFGPLGGSRLGVITATGAAGIMAMDACETYGFSVAQMPPELPKKLKAGKPDWIQAGNPLDIWPIGMIGKNYRTVYRTALVEMLKSPEIDAVLSIIPDFHSPLHPDTEIFDDLPDAVEEGREAAGQRKPAAMWVYMGNDETTERLEAVEGVTRFDSIDQAIQGLGFCRKYHAIKNTALPVQNKFAYDRDTVAALRVQGKRMKFLTGQNALRFLSAFGIPVVSGIAGRNVTETVQAAAKLGFPVVLKIAGKDFLHKTEWGGVVTDIQTARQLRKALRDVRNRVFKRDPVARIEAYEVQHQARGKELLLGIKRDPNFGPVIACGMGGIHAEVFNDVSRELVPVGRMEAGQMLSRLKLYPLLEGHRGEPGVHLDALIDVLERLSFLATEMADIQELDINPLMADQNGCLAVDARILW